MKPANDFDGFWALVGFVVVLTLIICNLEPRDLQEYGGVLFGVACIIGAIAMSMWMMEYPEL